MAENFLSWGTLGTFAGATGAVVLIVQFLKVPVDKLAKVSTRILVYIVSLILLLAAAFFTGKPFTLDSIALCAFNAFLVALSSMSLYEQAIAEPEAKKNGSIVGDTAQALATLMAQQTGVPIVNESIASSVIKAQQADAVATSEKGAPFDTQEVYAAVQGAQGASSDDPQGPDSDGGNS